jgi:hypothetical protein
MAWGSERRAPAAGIPISLHDNNFPLLLHCLQQPTNNSPAGSVHFTRSHASPDAHPLRYSISLNPSSLSSLHPDVLPALKQIFYPSAERLGIQIFSVSRSTTSCSAPGSSQSPSLPAQCMHRHAVLVLHAYDYALVRRRSIFEFVFNMRWTDQYPAS